MKLTPYPDLKMRWFKVCKHVFDKNERWWEILGDLGQWGRDWIVLNATGCLGRDLEESWDAIHPKAIGVLDRNHAAWLAAAERACDEALLAQRVYPTEDPGRSKYIGDSGLVVVVAAAQSLVTSYRPGGGRSRTTDEERVAKADAQARARSGYSLRAAVRRQERRASVDRALPKAPPTERDDA